MVCSKRHDAKRYPQEAPRMGEDAGRSRGIFGAGIVPRQTEFSSWRKSDAGTSRRTRQRTCGRPYSAFWPGQTALPNRLRSSIDA